MKKTFTLLFLLAFATATRAQVTFNWASSASSSGATTDATSIAVDASGNVITVGIFFQTTDFDPSAATFNLTPAQASYSDIFVTKFSPSGAFIWAKKLGGIFDDAPASVALNAAGDIFITGNFFGTADFDPDAGVANLLGTSIDAFVCKLNANGTFGWASMINGVGSVNGLGIALDASDNVYTTGTFEGTTDFNPSATVNNLTNSGLTDIYVSKLTSTGAYAWAVKFASAVEDRGTAITIDAFGNVITTGSFQATVDFNPGSGVNNLVSGGGFPNVFVCKLTSAGTYVWATSVSGGDAAEGTCVSTDPTGNVYVGGNFIGNADFDAGAPAYTLSSNGSADLFLMKLTSIGGFSYARSIGNASFDNVNSIKADASGNVFFTGVFFGTVDFDWTVPTQNLVSAGSADIYVAKYNPTGNYAWALRLGGTSVDISRTIALSSTGALHIAGRFSGTVDFNPSPTVAFSLTPVSASPGMFVQKMTPNFATPIQLLSFDGEQLETSNRLYWAAGSETNNSHFDIERSINGNDFGAIGRLEGAGNSAQKINYEFFDTQRQKGTNYYRLKQVDFDGKFSYSNVVELSSTIRNASFEKLYPNPSNGNFQFDFISIKESKLQVVITDFNGKKVFESVESLKAGTNTVKVSIASLPSGLYTLNIIDIASKFHTSKQIIKN